MDFFGILYDMKNGKKVPYSKTYFDTLFAAKLGGSDVKTLTGTLPLTFTTSETALRSWTIYGNDFQQEESKSTRLPLSFYTDEDKLRDWTIYGNNTPHNYSATGTLPLAFTTHTAGNAVDWVIEGNDEPGENLFDYSQGCDWASGSNGASHQKIIAQQGDVFTVTSSSALYALVRGYDANNAIISGSAWSTGGASTYTAPANIAYVKVVFRNFEYSAITTEQKATINEVMLVKGSTAPDHYIPYQQGVGEPRVDGYYVPLTISQAGKPDKTVDIYIGGSPLTEGETVSKASTGVDLELFEGENTISTTLYNKPETSITYTDYLGVGEYVNGQWQIPLSVSDGTNTTTVNVPIEAPLTASDTATRTSTGVDIATADGTNTISTTLENKPTMLVDYGYKGAGVHDGNTWEFNFITQANGNQQLTKITMDKPLRAGETLTSEQAGVTIPTYADAENTLSLYPNAAGYGNPEMTITYKGG